MYFRKLIIGLLLFSSSLAHAQEWGLIISPAISKGKLPRGVAVVHPGPPFFSGNLIVEERKKMAFAIEVFKEKRTRFRNVSYKVAFGYLSSGAFLHYDYDYANSIGNVVSTDRRFQYLTINALAKYSVSVKNVSVYACLGPHFGYLIGSIETRISFMNGEFKQYSFDHLHAEKKLNYGTQIAVGARYKSISVEGFYRSFYLVSFEMDNRRVVNYGMALSYYLRRK